MPDAYRRLDTAVLEALLLKGPLGLTDDDIDHKHGLDYSRTDEEALQMVLDGRVDAAFFMRPSPGQPGPRHRGGRGQHAAQVHVLLSEDPDGAAVQPAVLRGVESNHVHEGDLHARRPVQADDQDPGRIS